MPDSLAKYDPDTCLWRTSQACLFEGWTEFSETFPSSGTMRNGELYRPQTLAPPTSASGSGLWPTPSASQARSEGMIGQMRAKVEAGETTEAEAEAMISGSLRPARMQEWGNNGFGLRLQTAVKMPWATPSAADAVGTHGGGQGRSLRTDIHDWNKSLYPTPSAGGERGPTGLAGGAGNRQKLYDMLGKEEGKKLGCGSLNPYWVEWLMGYPLGWTVLKDSETP